MVSHRQAWVRCLKKKSQKTALVKIREAAWWETDVAIKHPSFAVIWLPTVDVRFVKTVSRSKGGKMYGETANIYLETDERWEKKEYNRFRVSDRGANGATFLMADPCYC